MTKQYKYNSHFVRHTTAFRVKDFKTTVINSDYSGNVSSNSSRN